MLFISIRLSFFLTDTLLILPFAQGLFSSYYVYPWCEHVSLPYLLTDSFSQASDFILSYYQSTATHTHKHKHRTVQTNVACLKEKKYIYIYLKYFCEPCILMFNWIPFLLFRLTNIHFFRFCHFLVVRKYLGQVWAEERISLSVSMVLVSFTFSDWICDLDISHCSKSPDLLQKWVFLLLILFLESMSILCSKPDTLHNILIAFI